MLLTAEQNFLTVLEGKHMRFIVKWNTFSDSRAGRTPLGAEESSLLTASGL